MTCMSCTQPSPDARHRTRPSVDASRRPSALAARAGGLIRKAWRAYWDWRARKVTVVLLRSLDPRTLHDIGIEPGEIESVIYGCGEGDRRRRYDAAWPWRSGGA